MELKVRGMGEWYPENKSIDWKDRIEQYEVGVVSAGVDLVLRGAESRSEKKLWEMQRAITTCSTFRRPMIL